MQHHMQNKRRTEETVNQANWS